MGNWLSTQSHKNSALVEAVEAENYESVKRWLDASADVNAKNDAGKTCLVIAVENQAGVEIVRLFVRAPGVDINAKHWRGGGGYSALYYAVYNNDLGVQDCFSSTALT